MCQYALQALRAAEEAGERRQREASAAQAAAVAAAEAAAQQAAAARELEATRVAANEQRARLAEQQLRETSEVGYPWLVVSW